MAGTLKVVRGDICAVGRAIICIGTAACEGGCEMLREGKTVMDKAERYGIAPEGGCDTLW